MFACGFAKHLHNSLCLRRVKPVFHFFDDNLSYWVLYVITKLKRLLDIQILGRCFERRCNCEEPEEAITHFTSRRSFLLSILEVFHEG